MVLEDIIIQPGQTLASIAGDYAYSTADWQKIWLHERNAGLRTLRGSAHKIKAGDKLFIPVPWKITSKRMSLDANDPRFFRIDVRRDGNKGQYLKWVQTVFDDNQPMQHTNFTVDWIDDDEPYYWTKSDLITDPGLYKHFWDRPRRNPPTTRTTTWRAVMSLCSVSGKRVSLIESIVWGVDFGKNGINTKYLPRPATEYEIKGHINLLTNGWGVSRVLFKNMGYTFRKAPRL